MQARIFFFIARLAHAATICLVLTFAAGSARAACVAPLAEDDALAPSDARSAHSFFELLVANYAGTLGDAPCDETYSVTHRYLGTELNVVVTGPAGTHYYSGATVPELPGIYEILIRRVVPLEEEQTETDVVVGNEGGGGQPDTGSALRTSYYARFSGAASLGADSEPEPDPGFGVGLRLMSGRAGLDVSAFNMTFDEGAPSGTWFRFMPVVEVGNPNEYQGIRPWFGAGIGWGTLSMEGTELTPERRADGLQFDVVAGISFLEDLPIQPFALIELGLPLFGVEADANDPDNDEMLWAPTLGVSFGFAIPASGTRGDRSDLSQSNYSSRRY